MGHGYIAQDIFMIEVYYVIIEKCAVVVASQIPAIKMQLLPGHV